MGINENKFWKKLLLHFKAIGKDLVYKALLLFYVLQRPNVPLWVKSSIIGALGYLISPIDAIVDITPMIGYSDDFAVIAAAVAMVSLYINDKVKEKAQLKYKELFKEEYN